MSQSMCGVQMQERYRWREESGERERSRCLCVADEELAKSGTGDHGLFD